MISLQPTIPTPQNLSPLDQLITLIQFFTDPKACAARLQKIMEEVDKAAEVIVNADTVKAEIAAERAALAAEREKHTEQMDADRKAIETQCIHRDEMINDRAKETERLNVAAKAARQEAEKLRDDLKLRVERVKSAAA
jgi:septal ring factor EnvC (AmiA/AmiB activator)